VTTDHSSRRGKEAHGWEEEVGRCRKRPYQRWTRNIEYASNSTQTLARLDSGHYRSPMQISPFQPPQRLLMGPGPSNVAPSVLRAMAAPVVGHLDPTFVRMMEEIKTMLRAVFQTKNEMTFPVSGTGSAGMEFCFVNLIEPGDEVIVGVNGVFGTRMVDVAERCGAKVIKVEAPWGRIIEPQQIAEALKTSRPKLVAIVHAETSTGALTPVEEISRLTHEAGALLVLDTVTSLGGCPVKIDDWRVDAVYSGTQKCLSCPPGLSPVSLSDRALEVATSRKRKVQSWYLDVNLLASYWGSNRVYHHTAPISMNYALHEALRLMIEEGLENRWRRHRQNHELLKKGLADLGLSIASQEGHQLWQLNAISVPEGTDEAAVRNQLLSNYSIEVGAGLGPLKGKIWRVGLMGETSKEENVQTFLNALRKILADVNVPASRPAVPSGGRSQ
jgi:alanine-glyoxylate transaminase / serine-glyoxylate transaminase / serine-pyruvate transaminase